MKTLSSPVATPMPSFVPVDSDSSGSNRSSNRRNKARRPGELHGQGSESLNQVSTTAAFRPAGKTPNSPFADAVSDDAREPTLADSTSGPALATTARRSRRRPGARDDGPRLFASTDHRDGRVGAHVIIESPGVVHLDDGLDPETLSHQATQVGSILIEYPSIGTDQCTHSAFL